MQRTFTQFLFFLFFSCAWMPYSQAQVLLNELSPDSGMSDGANDGIVELINAGAAAADIGCMVLSNGEWTVTIPDGTMLAAGEVFLIGCSDNSTASSVEGLTCDRCDFAGLALDLDVCTNTAAITPGSGSDLTLDNENSTDGDQVALFDESGNILDAVMWTTGSHVTGGSDVDLTANGAETVTAPNDGAACNHVNPFTLPVPADAAWTQLTDFIRGCNTSYIRDIGSTGTGAAGAWSVTNHPNPGQANDAPAFDFSISATELCGPGTVTVTAEIYNYQNVQPTIFDIANKYGSYIKDETGTIIAWPSISSSNGTTTLSYTSGILAAGTYTFVAQWDDYTEGCCGSTSPTSGNECYERQKFTVTVSEPMALSGTDAIVCPADFELGQVDLSTLVTGGGNNTYELFDNGVSQGSSATGVFTILDTYTGPITAVATNGTACGLANINFTIDNSCRLLPPCPMITSSSFLKNGAACGSSGGSFSSTTCPLDPGTIAFVGYNADGTDTYSFLVLGDIDAGTTISFTDNRFNGTVLLANESTQSWTAPAGGVSAGTIVTITGNVPTVGTVTGSTALGLAAGGDQIIAYCGTAATPTFVAAINNEGAAIWQATTVETNNASALPTGLTDGTTAVALNEVDNAAFGCAGGAVSGSPADILAMINNTANWTITDDAAAVALPACTYTINAAPPMPCMACPGDEITMSVDGTDLPAGGTIDFYMTTASTDLMAYSASTAGTLIGSIDIPAAAAVVCDPAGGIVINEVGSRPSSGDAGGGGEYIELKNTSCSAIDIGCMVLSDGDWTFVIPDGVMLGSLEFYVIGASAAVPNVDLIGHDGVAPNPNTAGSNSASNILNFTNGTEQVVLFADDRSIIDAIEWGGGQSLPATLTPTTVTGCSTADVTLPIIDPATYTSASTPSSPGESISLNEAGSLVSLAETPGVENFMPSVPPPAPIIYTIPESLCNQGPQFIRGIINPFVEDSPTGCNEVDPTSATVEFEFSVACTEVMLSGDAVSCTAPVAVDLAFMAGATGMDYTVTLLNNTTMTTEVIALTNVTIPGTETLDLTSTGEYTVQSVVPAMGCDANVSGTADIAISDSPVYSIASTAGASCEGGVYEVVLTFDNVEFPVEFEYTIDGGTPIAGVANTSPFILLTSMTGDYEVTTATDGIGCPFTTPGIVSIVPPVCTGSISGNVWYDGTIDVGDGVNTAEPAAPGVVVNLFSANGTFVGTTTTDANGDYSFTGVAPGDYYVEFEYPIGYEAAPTVGAGPGVDGSDVIPTGASGVDQTLLTLDDVPGGQTAVFSLLDNCFAPCDVVGIDAGIVGPMPLPIELVDFTATKRDANVLLEWSTALEINNDKYIIERSNNGEDFTMIGAVQGAGNSSTTNNYSYVDERPFFGINYYRLRQVDFDGSSTLSQVEVVRFETESIEMVIAPNPSSDYTYVNLTKGLEQEATLEVFNVLGARVGQVLIDQDQMIQRLNINFLPNGTYFVRLQVGDKLLTQKIVKAQ